MEKRFRVPSYLLQILAVAAVLLLLYLSRLYSYVLMHTLVEMFSIVVACSIFMITWNTRRFITNNYILFIGISLLFVSTIDLLHTLAYKGLNVFPGFDANLSTQLWIAARYTSGISLLIAPLIIDRRLRPAAVFGTYAGATAIVLASIFIWRVFPDCFIEGTGLTRFKIVSEYVVSAFFLTAFGLLVRRRGEFERGVIVMLGGFILFQVIAEMLFTVYNNVYGPANMIGHFFKVTAFYLFYKALVETALVKPYDILFRNLKRSETELRDERDQVQNYLDVARTMLVVIGADQRITLINRMGCEILGYPEDEILGTNWFDRFIPAGIRDMVRETFNKLMAGEVTPVEYFENPVVTKSGEERVIAWHNAVLNDEEGRIIATLSSGEDITARKATEAALARKTEELERSNAELDQFASIVSHDLKAPLHTIGGFADLIRERYAERLDEKGKDNLERIVAGVGRMERLITDMLAFSRVTTRGRDFEDVPAERILETALANLKIAIDESRATVTTDPLPTVQADEMQLLELFQNLIGNAIKYRGDDPPRIHISVRQLDESESRTVAGLHGPVSETGWLFSVTDNGIGIDPQHHESIFRIFERLDKSGRYDGTGVGLAVCKKIVERHGGRIWVESEPGKGSSFYFILP